MEARLLEVWGDPPDPALVAMVVRHLDQGGLVALPTETVYGFGCALREEAIRRIQWLKSRGPDKPFLVLAPSLESVEELAWTPEARELARVFWPGALTLVLADPGRRFPPGIRSPEGKVAVRMSPHPLAREVVAGLGEPVVSTSANLPGAPPSLTASQALEVALDLGAGQELWVLDGGPLPPSDPSTILDFTGGEPVLLRPGAIPLGRLRCVLPEIHESY